MAGRRAIRKSTAVLNTPSVSCPRSRSRSLSPRTRSTRPSTPSPRLQKPDRSATARSSSSTSTMRFASAPARPMPRHSDFALNLIHSGVKQMTFKRPYSAGLAALAVGLFAATAAYAEPTVNKGDNAWMLTSTVLVLLMTIPGLALFYGGLVRSKNMLSVLMQVFYTVCMVTVLWALYGYSLAFTGGSDFIGGFSKAFLMGVTTDSKAATFSVDANISELVYVCFQMTFAAITPALIVGAFAERMKFAAVALFIPLWVTLIYFPIAHMVWYWAGPDAISAALKAVETAADGAAKTTAQAAFETAKTDFLADGGWVFQKGAIDFA